MVPVSRRPAWFIRDPRGYERERRLPRPKKLRAFGEVLTLEAWCALFDKSALLVCHRVFELGWCPEDALTLGSGKTSQMERLTAAWEHACSTLSMPSTDEGWVELVKEKTGWGHEAAFVPRDLPRHHRACEDWHLLRMYGDVLGPKGPQASARWLARAHSPWECFLAWMGSALIRGGKGAGLFTGDNRWQVESMLHTALEGRKGLLQETAAFAWNTRETLPLDLRVRRAVGYSAIQALASVRKRTQARFRLLADVNLVEESRRARMAREGRRRYSE